MKFDIVKYITDQCRLYLQGECDQEDTLAEIQYALADNSWQRQCNNHRVINNRVNVDGVIYTTHSDWCINDKTEDD